MNTKKMNFVGDIVYDGNEVSPILPIVEGEGLLHPYDPLPDDKISTITVPASAKTNCYSYTVTNVSNQSYGIGYTDCCTGKDVNFTLEAGEKMDNVHYDSHDYHTNDLVISNLIDYNCVDVLPADVKATVLPPAEEVKIVTPDVTVANPITNTDLLVGAALVLGGAYFLSSLK